MIMAGEPCERNKELNGPGIEDLAPTVLHLLGFPIPRDMDGRVLEEAFTESFLKENRLRFSEPWDPAQSEFHGFAPEEESAVRKQLEGLGYL